MCFVCTYISQYLCDVIGITLGWVLDRSFTPTIAQLVTPSTFDVVQVTGSNLTSNVSFTETLARAHLKKHTHISLDTQVMKRSG